LSIERIRSSLESPQANAVSAAAMMTTRMSPDRGGVRVNGMIGCSRWTNP
jgi:hypothetical protein